MMLINASATLKTYIKKILWYLTECPKYAEKWNDDAYVREKFKAVKRDYQQVLGSFIETNEHAEDVAFE